MIVEKTAAKKSLAVTLALALGLSLPGVGWSQAISARVAPVAGAGAEAAAASYAGAQSITLSLPTISAVPSLSAAPAISAPAAMPMSAPSALAAPAAVESHPVIGLINQLQKAGVSLPDTVSSYSDAARIEEAARALPEGSTTRAKLASLAASIRASRAGEASGGAGDSGKVFDGAKAAPAAAETPSAPAVAETPAKGGIMSRLARLLPAPIRNAVRGRKNEVPAPAPASAPEPAPIPEPQPADPKSYELSVNEVRYAPDAARLPESTKAIASVSKQIVGQDDALKAIRFALEMAPAHYNLYVAGAEGSGRAMAIRRILREVAPKMKTPNDLVAATNFGNPDSPVVLEFAPGKGAEFAAGVEGFVEAMKENLPVAIASGEAGQKKQQILAKVQAAQAKAQAEFDSKIASMKLGRKFGVFFKAAPGEQGMKIMLGATYEGQPMTPDEVKAKIAAGAFTQAEWDAAQAELQQKKGGILEGFQAMMTVQLEMMQKVQAAVAKIDQQAAIGLINQFASQLAEIATQGPETAADKAFQEKAQERDAEINEELQKLAGQKFGKFGVALQAGMGQDGMPIVVAMPAFDQMPVDDATAAKLVAAGKIAQAEYDTAKAAILKKAQAIQQKAAEYVAQTRREHEELAASKPAPGPEALKVKAYVQALANYAASSYKIFLGIKEGGEGIKPMPGSRPMDPADFFRVSVLTDNSATKGAPVVWEENPTYERLFGAADGNQRNMVIPGVGIVKAEGVGGPTFKAGSFLKANGGYLVLRAMDVLRNPGAWQALMQAVRTGQAEIAEGGLLGVASMKGDIYHIPAKVKVVLIGSPMIQMLLGQHDEDFAMNFQGVAHFQPTIKITEDAVDGYLNFLKHAVAGSAGQILELTRDAIERVLERAARLADSNKYFTAQFGALYNLLQEASYWAQKAGRSEVRGEDVETALEAKRDREEVHVKRMMELYQKNVFRVDTSGAAVGQINGLAVMGSFGVPMRITFVAVPGMPGIVSVDKDAGTTGSSFNKALGNEWGFVVNEFGTKAPVRAQIRVSHEQNYGGIDGDSATSTTIYGILSALSGVPIKQNFAVTGSADQFGNVQAIGGINEKIEGFFALCKHRGLTGDQGVIMPKSNVADLQLSPEVSAAIAAGRFHIYAVDHVSQGIEILTGAAYATIKAKAEARLAEMSKALLPPAEAGAGAQGQQHHGH